MPVWCPDCKAMLPDGTKECPVCGSQIGGASEDKPEFERSEYVSVTLYLVGIALIPILLIIVISVLCVVFAH